MPRPCQKVKFATEEAAQFHIAKNKARNDAKGLKARVYLCPCSSYHITSKPTFQETEAMWMQFAEWAKACPWVFHDGYGWRQANIYHAERSTPISTKELFQYFIDNHYKPTP